MESLFATLFPGDCRICSEPLTNISRLPVCGECLQDLKIFDAAQCAVCGELLFGSDFHGESQSGDMCALCRRLRPDYVRAVSFGPYEGALRDLIHLLKYQRVRSAARFLGEKLAIAIRTLASEMEEDEIALVVPVPLHDEKFRQRGFNQTQLVASSAVKTLRPHLALEFDPGVLRRKRATLSQTGLTRHQRRQNVRGAFVVDPRFRRTLVGRNVILVDDVFTTGTTAEECARILQRAGAAKVWVATIARVSKLKMIDVSSIQREETILAATGAAANS